MEIERTMKMNCMDKLEKVLNNGGMPDIDTLEHINMCPHCKRLGDDWAELSGIKTGNEKEVPREIEESILAAAAEYADKRRCNHRSFVLLKWPVISSAAACFIFSFATLLYMNVRQEAPAPHALPAKQYISFAEKWNAIDMTEELNEIKSKLDSQISELASPSMLIDFSKLKQENSLNKIS